MLNATMKAELVRRHFGEGVPLLSWPKTARFPDFHFEGQSPCVSLYRRVYGSDML